MDPLRPSSSARRRFHVRRSVRAILVVVLVIGLALSGVVHLIRSAEAQRAAIEALEEAGCVAWYEWEWRDGKPVSQAKPPYPRWLVRRLGIDFLAQVVSIDLFGTGSDVLLAHVGQIQALEVLDATCSKGDSPVTDAGLVHLKRLTGLRVLKLDGNDISDAGLAHLRNLTSLQELDLRETLVTDAGLVQLKGLSQLRGLDLSGTEINDAGLVHLKRLKRLKWLDLSNTRVSIPGVQDLQRSLPQSKIIHPASRLFAADYPI
jgi:Leucine rich repeat/Leucine Rich repeat